MKLSAAILAAALGLCAFAPPSHAAAADPTFLTCKFDNGRTILGLVVFKTLKKLRIWYGDGGGQEWTDVDYSKPAIETGVQDGRHIVLSKDFRQVTFNDEDEHAKGRCEVASRKGKPARWFAPALKQHDDNE